MLVHSCYPYLMILDSHTLVHSGDPSQRSWIHHTQVQSGDSKHTIRESSHTGSHL